MLFLATYLMILIFVVYFNINVMFSTNLSTATFNSTDCQKAAVPFLCQYVFPLRQCTNGDVYMPSKEQCLYVSTEVCTKEWQLAEQFVPNCTIFPPQTYPPGLVRIVTPILTYTYMYIHTYVHTYTYIHIHNVHTYIHTYIRTCTHIHTYTYTHTHTHTHTHTYVHTLHSWK